MEKKKKTTNSYLKPPGSRGGGRRDGCGANGQQSPKLSCSGVVCVIYEEAAPHVHLLLVGFIMDFSNGF